MDKKTVLFYKAFVVGVIVLFIGIGIQPAIAKVNPDIIGFKLDNIDKDEITVKINEIMQKYGNFPLIQNSINFISDTTGILTWMYILIYLVFVGMGLALYALMKLYFYYYYYYY